MEGFAREGEERKSLSAFCVHALNNHRAGHPRTHTKAFFFFSFGRHGRRRASRRRRRTPSSSNNTLRTKVRPRFCRALWWLIRLLWLTSFCHSFLLYPAEGEPASKKSRGDDDEEEVTVCICEVLWASFFLCIPGIMSLCPLCPKLPFFFLPTHSTFTRRRRRKRRDKQQETDGAMVRELAATAQAKGKNKQIQDKQASRSNDQIAGSRSCVSEADVRSTFVPKKKKKRKKINNIITRSCTTPFKNLYQCSGLTCSIVSDQILKMKSLKGPDGILLRDFNFCIVRFVIIPHAKKKEVSTKPGFGDGLSHS